MRLSMWILADRLEPYSPEIHIRQGERNLRNARLFSDSRNISRTTVYLEQIRADRILCSSGHDYLVLRATDVDEVFNQVLDIFESCNNWASDAYECIGAGCGLDELLDRGAAFLDRAWILADAAFYMREVRCPHDLLPMLPSVREAMDSRLLPLEALLRLSELEHIRVPGLPSYVITPEGVRPSAAVTNLFSGRNHLGWLIAIRPEGRYSRGDLDLQDAFAEQVTAWIQRNGVPSDGRERSGVFKELLEGAEAEDVHAAQRLKTFGWYPGDGLTVYAIGAPGPGPERKELLQRELERVCPHAFFLRQEERLLAVVNDRITPWRSFEAALKRSLEPFGCGAGKSRAFTELSELHRGVAAAELALRHGAPGPGEVRSPDDAALSYAAWLLREKADCELRHPALRALEEYDRQHGSGFKETLRRFLRHNCGCAETAKALFIHRSTLLYRLGRIQEITGLDLEDYGVRLWLELSFLMEEA